MWVAKTNNYYLITYMSLTGAPNYYLRYIHGSSNTTGLATTLYWHTWLYQCNGWLSYSQSGPVHV